MPSPLNPSRPAELHISTKTPPDPLPPSVLPDIQRVVDITDLNANAGMAARLSNLSTANITSTTNRGAQNAIANQQAHAQLTVSITGKTANKVQNLGPLAARGSVDVLTNNALAQTLMDLKGAIAAFTGPGFRPGPVNPSQLRRILRRLIAEIQHIQEVNARLTGNGRLSNVEGGQPYTIVDQPLYVQAGTLGFYGCRPADLDLNEIFGEFTSP